MATLEPHVDFNSQHKFTALSQKLGNVSLTPTSDIFTRYEGQARQVLVSLVDKYANAGIDPIEDPKVFTSLAFSTIGPPWR